VNSGQVFRWRSDGDAITGVDGASSYRVRRLDDQLEVESEATPDDFGKLFSLDQDLPWIHKRLVEQEPKLAPYIAALPGLRIMCPANPVEVVFGFLCTSCNNLERIRRMVDSLAEYGQPGGANWKLFPTLERIAEIDQAELRAKGFGYRGATIPRAAREIIARGGLRWLQDLRSAEYRHAAAELTSIPAIGPKLADCMILFALHNTWAVPIDTHIWQAATRLFFGDWSGKAVTAVRYRAIGDLFRERFGDLAGWAQQYLFFENLLAWRTRSSGSRLVKTDEKSVEI
jgi:N-glycosylase/DNA lyase